MDADTREFFVVWNPAGSNPQHRHNTYEGAALEAKRLAKLAPGTNFYVLHALSVSRVKDPVETVELNYSLPF